jgi:hypothetical protein
MTKMGKTTRNSGYARVFLHTTRAKREKSLEIVVMFTGITRQYIWDLVN